MESLTLNENFMWTHLALVNKTGLQHVSRPVEQVHYIGGWVEGAVPSDAKTLQSDGSGDARCLIVIFDIKEIVWYTLSSLMIFMKHTYKSSNFGSYYFCHTYAFYFCGFRMPLKFLLVHFSLKTRKPFNLAKSLSVLLTMFKLKTND